MLHQGLESANDLMQSLLSPLQWWPQYVQHVPLHFKRRWLSEKLRCRVEQPKPVLLEVQRENLLDCLCSGLDQCTDTLRWGIDVSFTDGEEDWDKEDRDWNKGQRTWEKDGQEDEDMDKDHDTDKEDLDEDEDDDHDYRQKDQADQSCTEKDRKEFFRLAAEEFMEPELGLFVSKDGGRSYHVSPGEGDAKQLKQLQLCGKLIGLALLHGEPVTAMKLSRPLRRLLLGSPIRPLEDMAAVDPEFYQNQVGKILDYKEGEPLGDLGLTFVDEAAGKAELCLGGAERQVTEENKMQYLDLLCHYRLVDSIRPQVDALLSGVQALLPSQVQAELQRVLTATELGLCLWGESAIDLKSWKEKSKATPEMAPGMIEEFWKAVEGMTNEQQHALLEYTTGGFTAEGAIEGLTLAPTEGLVPETVPGYNTLKLPKYGTLAEMRSALLRAATYGNEGAQSWE
ncbi:E3 ubiquitin-protein ligase NEDD4-like (HECT-type E3 ubiquitin transferase NED4L) (NEDD4.2) (Nedd4-2) [Durusdinium trenchii]|uniref:HECT-type E3 ubiquitin transferase n=1 Tax=Durusdinium trenchii TaxID=1381693 RepID=A0ABP0JAS6_9DINO